MFWQELKDIKDYDQKMKPKVSITYSLLIDSNILEILALFNGYRNMSFIALAHL